MVGFLAYRYSILPHTWRAPHGRDHSPHPDSVARNFYMDFPGGDTLVPDLDCCRFPAEGEEKSFLKSLGLKIPTDLD